MRTPLPPDGLIEGISSDIDPFGDEFLRNPWPYLEELREIAPVVYFPMYHIWGVARHEEVTEVLRDFTTYSSAAGVGYTNMLRDKPWRVPSIILEADPPLHSKTRRIVSKVLTSSALARLKTTFEERAFELVDQLLERGRFDAISDLAEEFPLAVFPDSVGLQPGSRQNLLRYGAMVFNGHGPRNHIFEEAMKDTDEVRDWVNAQCSREMLAPDGFGEQIYRSVDTGELTEEEAGLLVRSFLSAGVDTTVNALGFAVLDFARNPEQWAELRADPSLARDAFEEVVRLEAPVAAFFRTTTRPTEISGVSIPADAKLLVFFAGACRDPRRWDNPDSFEIHRHPVGHTGFGSGIHSCVGAMVARLEGEVLLGVLAKRVKRIELAGEPKVRLNNTLRGLKSLPVRIYADD